MGEWGVDPEQIPEQRDRLYLNLYHHVPMMKSNGVIDHDRDDDRLVLTVSPSVEGWIATILKGCVNR